MKERGEDEGRNVRSTDVYRGAHHQRRGRYEIKKRELHNISQEFITAQGPQEREEEEKKQQY